MALPKGCKNEELRRELAVTLYREEMLSFGKARELVGLSKYEFGQLLGDQSVERHYGREELEEDLRNGDRQPPLAPLNLAIGELKLVGDQFDSDLAPPTVVDELRLDTKRSGTLALIRALEDEWIGPKRAERPVPETTARRASKSHRENGTDQYRLLPPPATKNTLKYSLFLHTILLTPRGSIFV